MQTKIQPVILITGACGQLGTELTAALRSTYGSENIIASDIHPATVKLLDKGRYESLNVSDIAAIEEVVSRNGVTQIYHLAAVLSANGEKNPLGSWELNMKSLLNVLETARICKVQKVFWPSSIAVFGPDAPKINCPQQAVANPVTVYGISKLAGEHWCAYYQEQYGLDVRSLRYPGLISYSAPAGGGTTDYAVAIFHEALKSGRYTCFLSENTQLPMMYMPDAVRATLELMSVPKSVLHTRGSYNLAGFSFTPEELAAEIKSLIPEFEISYLPDTRQQIADSWPFSIEDDTAREEWGWQPAYDLKDMCADMFLHLDPENARRSSVPKTVGF